MIIHSSIYYINRARYETRTRLIRFVPVNLVSWRAHKFGATISTWLYLGEFNEGKEKEGATRKT